MATHRVLSSHELVSEIFSTLPLQKILDDLTKVNSLFRTEAIHTAVARFSTMLNPYVADHVNAIIDLLREQRSIIIGSCALHVLLGLPSWKPRNLNIVVPRDAVNIFITFFNSKGYSPTQVRVPAHLLHYVSRSFRCDSAVHRPTVTITESIDSSALTPFLASDCTAEFVFMTGGGIASFYPSLTSSHIALRSPDMRGVPSVTRSLVERGFVLKHTFEHDPHEVCPSAWRRVNGLRGIWVRDWDRRNSAHDIIVGEHHRWRLGTVCTHPDCLLATRR
ncbi:hypothetical protein BJ138DRAFT_1118276 [Hygrophoropsis aurantiaca]|uniref:Uncharacterized protein n=1 Tax=Hygrophoropsis aurantiaca TaxID=72124 RepID=A0ACB7ZXI1_9AGAM|nr:hypothetical protein BJ138DRAFT_1118276 [Hygrophoropsis aurantiaca]